MIQDVKPYTGINLRFQTDIETRRIELAKHMGILKKIPVYELGEHWIVPDIDTDSDGQVAGTYGEYCMNCRKDKSDCDNEDCKWLVSFGMEYKS